MYQNLFVQDDTIWLFDDQKGMYNIPTKNFNYAYRKNSKGKHLSFTGERCSKVYRFVRNTSDLFESDLPIETRVLTDIYLNDDEPSVGHRLLIFDIEVSLEKGIPDIQKAENEIISISVYDWVTDEYHALVLDKKKEQKDFSVDNEHVKFYDSEYDLLNSFLDLWENISPTIITGWNSDHFDVPYTYHRLQRVLGYEQALKLSCIQKIKYSKYRKKYQIAGISSLDYLDIYKKFTYTQLPNYRLDTVGQVELSVNKVKYEGTLDELYQNNIKEFIRYNITDVKIIVGLEKKLKLIELIRGICHIGHVPYEDYCYSSRFLEGTIVTYLHRKGMVATDKDPANKDLMDTGEQFSGAYVKTPYPAKYDWIFSLDLQSLYPSIMMSLNISPEVKVGKVLGNFDNKKLTEESTDKLSITINENNTTLTYKDLKSFIQQENLNISSNGILYLQNKRGVLSSVLEHWFDERVKSKKLMIEYSNKGDKEQTEYYDRRQQIQKVLANSLYGVVGLPVFRFFDVDNALAVTACGQDIIKTSEKFVNKIYEELGAIPKSLSDVSKYQIILNEEATKKKETPEKAHEKDWCVYVDTDSIYFSSLPLKHKFARTDILSNTIKLTRLIEKRLNDYYDEMSVDLFNCEKHRFRIKGETIAKSGIWIAKKRYALLKIYDLEKDTKIEPKVIVKGLDTVRSSFPIKFKNFMKDFMLRLLQDVDKNDIDKILIEFYNELNDVPYREIARNIAVKNVYKYGDTNNLASHTKGTPMHAKSAINYNDLLKKFNLDKKYAPITDGEKIKYVLLKDNPFKLEVLAFKDYQDPPQIIDFIKQYCDHKKLFDAELKKKLQDFYSAMGWGELPMDINIKANEFFSFN